ncbi:hypothetical protein C8R45DRAFT_770172, partial [Mycena sanguinolenta]
AHPQYTTHCMKKLTDTEVQRVPVLAGIPIPRADKDEDQEAYQVAMLALFKPWGVNMESPLKPPDSSWNLAYNEMMLTVSAADQRIMHNMQLIHKSRDAKHDFSAMRR